MNSLKKTILLVEDEPNIAFSLRFILERAGYIVDHAADGPMAETRANSIRPDLIILDIMLPNTSGFEVLESLRAKTATRETAVIMLTARGQATDRERAKELGANKYMTKPFSNADILASVEELIGK